MIDKEVLVIGAGLAGLKLLGNANSGIKVTLVEMRPLRSTPAHHTGEFGELVCSNSFGALNLIERRPSARRIENIQLFGNSNSR